MYRQHTNYSTKKDGSGTTIVILSTYGAPAKRSALRRQITTVPRIKIDIYFEDNIMRTQVIVKYGITGRNIKLPYSVFNQLPQLRSEITVGCVGWQCLSHTSAVVTVQYGQAPSTSPRGAQSCSLLCVYTDATLS